MSEAAAHAPTAAMNDWVRDFFGVDVDAYASPSGRGASALATATPAKGPGKLGGAAKRAAADPAVWTRSVGPALTKDGPGKPGARIRSPVPTGPATVCEGAGGKKVSITKAADGSVALTRDPPPITEITFSGGGGKGAALPGAVWALAKTGALAQAKEMHGASVGSMTAAMLAAGTTPQDFQDLSDNTDFESVVKGGDLLMVNVKGDGLESLVRNAMKSSINKQIAAFASDAMAKGTKVDPKTLELLDAMSKKFASGGGPTFGDLRTLSKIIPAIKEVVISGTLIGVSDPPKPGQPPGPIKDTKPELKVFSADTEPDMDVALAVHASAALPPVFKPVEIKMKNGQMGRFEDGGVLNNAPSSDTLGTDRAVDPVPTEGKMTFVFEEDASHGILQGKATPDRSRINDLVSRADNSAAEYAKNKTLSERPEDVVMVPLKFKRTTGKEADFSGFIDGTVNFNMKKDDRVKLQGMTEEATQAYVEKQRQPETRAFASDAQMLNCVPRDDLAAMAASDYPGAKETLKFRDAVLVQVGELEKLAATGMNASNPKIHDLLEAINDLAEGDQERVAFIGRSLNRSGKLDRFLAASKDPNGKDSTGIDALDAGIAVNEVVQAKAIAKKILEQTLYPKMVVIGTKGVAGQLLKQMEDILRNAKNRRDINRALTIGIDYFDKIDVWGAVRDGAIGGLLGPGGSAAGAYRGATSGKKFAAELRAYIQPLH